MFAWNLVNSTEVRKLEFYNQNSSAPLVLLDAGSITAIPYADADVTIDLQNSMFILTLPYNVTAEIRAWSTLDLLIGIPTNGSGPCQPISPIGLCWGNATADNSTGLNSTDFTLPNNDTTSNYGNNYTTNFPDQQSQQNANQLCGSIGSCGVPPVCAIFFY